MGDGHIQFEHVLFLETFYFELQKLSIRHEYLQYCYSHKCGALQLGTQHVGAYVCVKETIKECLL